MREYTKKPESQSRSLESNPKASRQAPIDVILQRYKEQNIQRSAEGKESIQGKFDTAQREEIDEDELLQGKLVSVSADEHTSVQRDEKPNNTGLPDNLKIGIENLSGYNMDDVQVHYNSVKPSQLQALAYAQGTDIHIAPGQEQHLPHEAWHVVQQKQGRVQPTIQIQGVNINDNEGLEKEADEMRDSIYFQKEAVYNKDEKIKISDNHSKTIQAVLNISKSTKSPFYKLNYKIFKALTKKKHEKKRIEISSDQWVNLKKMASSEDSVTFETWADAVFAATNWIPECERIAEESEMNKQKVKEYLSSLKCVRIGFIEGINFGNIMSGLALMQSLNELGYGKKIVFVCSQSVKDKILKLNNKLDQNNFVSFEEKDEFNPEIDYDTPTSIDEKSISFMTNGDVFDEETNKKVLDYMNTNICLIMNPYGWMPDDIRKLLHRKSVDQEDIQEVKMDKKINREALYIRNLDNPSNLIEYIKTELGVDNDKLKGILSVLGKVIQDSVLLQPVYGLHTLDDESLVNSEAVLSKGLYDSKAAKKKPIVILMLNKSRLDYIPPYSQSWLFRKNIIDKDIDTALNDLKKGEIMILDCMGLPNSVFTQIFRKASLPPLIEGANTSNLVQLIGIPWMSPRTNTTEFPFADKPKYKHIISSLHKVRDSLTSRSGMSEHLEGISDYIHFKNLDAVYRRLNQIETLLKIGSISYSDLKILSKEIQNADLKGVTSGSKILTAISEIELGKGVEEYNPLDDSIREKMIDENFTGLKLDVDLKMKESKQNIIKSLKDKEYDLDIEAIKSITQMVDDSMDDTSELSAYFQDIHKSTKSDERDQVLQVLLMLINLQKINILCDKEK